MELPAMTLWAFLSFLLVSSTHVPCFFGSAAHFSNETDHLALLHFKDLITDGPLHSLSSWNHTLHFCLWQGVICDSRRHPQRVTALILSNKNLVGPISPFIGNLTFLKRIDLGNNSFSGPIPEQMGQLLRLRFLRLRNNTLTGEIPTNLTYCSKLQVLHLRRNQLSGRIPTEIGSLSKLTFLSLGNNNLAGSIPLSLGNLSSLSFLYLSINSLDGSIPDDLGRLASLEGFGISENELSGTIPPQLYNLSSIKFLDVGFNRLHGNLPPNLGLSLPNLQELYTGRNQFTGPIPISLSNASGLVHIDLDSNSFSGSVPTNFGSLKGLSVLLLWGNKLGIGKSHDLIFLDSLTNCSSLRVLQVRSNHLSCALPDSMSNISSQLTWLTLGHNKIFGSIPSGIQNLVGLTLLEMGYNFLTGTIPIGIGKLNKARKLSFEANELSGQIPSSLGNISQLLVLVLSENNLSGIIPSTIGNCINLQFIYLNSNKFSSSLPRQLFIFPSLIELYIGNNSFTGSLPVEVGYLKTLSTLNVSNNKLSGEIPSSLGNCLSLEYLLLDGNFFQESIPPTFSTLRGLRSLDLSRNNLSGEIPKYLEKLALESLNLSFNNFEGELPKQGVFGNASQVSVLGNNKLCGGIPELNLPQCSSQASKKRRKYLASKVKISVVVVFLCLVLVSCMFATLYWVRKSRRKPVDVPSAEDPFVTMSYAELFKATDGFSSTNLVGTGSFGAVYKGALDRDGTMVAVKVFNLQQQGAPRSFMAECEALKNIRHRNLVKILTCCVSIDFKGNDFKALVYEYMPNESLDKWLHRDGGDQLGRNLKFIQMLNIAIDVASALDYLHNHCQTPIIHRDLKPSNILLDDEMIARVGDFGLARFLPEVAQTSSVGIKGSVGYIAPEYAMGSKASTQGDVYSYGILLLEMITGKQPTDGMFTDNLSLHHFAKLALPERVMEIVEPQLLIEDTEVTQGNGNHINTRNRMHECLILMVRIGVLCSLESLGERMCMKDVASEMHAIKNQYLGVRIHRHIQVRSQMLDGVDAG
ncbi:probable LRR receptor-like serine/threonine-protein kinase At3g47570 isoform X2 [Magnolia sinica]|uniref:probable LRR receptor-like serine/threonine-protein kinase At3g47570 isoform X2 n=1 Tax=Magnolia sinica TaxID=86752 RepID=UPI00265AC3E1|nr:probable LRR receptor-like serine/threonine-protein kinase At3g47570 isoform X2 [Magnolia sinica]